MSQRRTKSKKTIRMKKIERLFDLMYQKTKKFRTLYPNGDGLGLWRQIKKDLDDDYVFFKWKTQGKDV